MEIGVGLATLLGTVVTTVGGVFVLWLTQRNEFRKAREQRHLDREAAEDRLRELDRNSDKRAAKVVEKVNVAAEQVAEKVAEKVDLAAGKSELDSQVKRAQLDEIHSMVNGRMTAAKEEIKELKVLIMRLLDVLGPGNAELRAKAKVAIDKEE